MTETAQTTEVPCPGPWLGRVLALALGTFVVGTDAFVIAGLLPDISSSLDISTGAAGQLVSVFSLAYALLSPALAALTSRWSRRTTLVTALLVFAAGNAATALAPGYALILVSRVVAAAGAAMFTPGAGATAAALAGARHRGRAIAVVASGLTASLVLGAPLGTVLGNALGWRSTMWAVAGLALLVAPVVAVRLTGAPAVPPIGLRRLLDPLTDRGVVGVLLVTLTAFTGIYLPYTYIGSVFEPAVEDDGTALLLLVFGLFGTAGNLAAGRFGDRKGPRTAVITATLLLTAVFTLMPVGRGVYVAAVLLVAVSGLGSWAVTAPQQQRIIGHGAAGSETLLIALNAAVLYLAVSLAGVLGAGVLHILGAAYVPLVAACFTATAATVTAVAGRAGKRAGAARRTATRAPFSRR